MLKESEKYGPQWERRRRFMESEQKQIEKIPSAQHPSEKHEIAILAANLGNILRSGQTEHSAQRCHTLLGKFLLGEHAQIVLVQEANSLDIFHLQEFQKIIQEEPATDCAIIVSERLVPTQQLVLESKQVNPFGEKKRPYTI